MNKPMNINPFIFIPKAKKSSSSFAALRICDYATAVRLSNLKKAAFLLQAYLNPNATKKRINCTVLLLHIFILVFLSSGLNVF